MSDFNDLSFSQSYGSILPTSLIYIVLSTRGYSPWRPAAGFVNDPSTGSPTETLLRLLFPLNNSVSSTSRLPPIEWFSEIFGLESSVVATPPWVMSTAGHNNHLLPRIFMDRRERTRRHRRCGTL